MTPFIATIVVILMVFVWLYFLSNQKLRRELRSVAEQRKALDEKYEELKSKFVSNVSHELRTPLVTIQKSLSIVRDQAAGSLNETQEKFVEIAERNLKNLSLLINNMIDTAKIEAGREQPQHKREKKMIQPLKILLVDDQPDFVETLSFWLKSKGHTVGSALNGEEGIRAIQAGRFDLVFLDVHMPTMDGLETLTTIRETNKSLPVILLTAYPEEAITDKAKELGISGFFPKEGSFEKLTDVIEVALRMQKGHGCR